MADKKLDKAGRQTMKESKDFLFREISTEEGRRKALHGIEAILGENFCLMSSDDYEKIEKALLKMQKNEKNTLADFIEYFSGPESQKKVLASYII